MIQQGDVIARSVVSVPEGAHRLTPGTRGFVLAEGEATGHAHVVPAVPGVDVWELDGKVYLSIEETVEALTQTHEEHAPVTYKPGIYEVGRVREKDWLSDAVRFVAD